MSRRGGAAAAAGAGHPWPAWFQDSVQHAQLLTNKTLREYLLAHSAERWPAVAKATLLYGVLCLRRDFPVQPVLPLEQLHEAARQLHTEAALGAALPAIRSQFESLEAELGGCLAEVDTNAVGEQGPKQEWFSGAPAPPAASIPPRGGPRPPASTTTAASPRPPRSSATSTAGSEAPRPLPRTRSSKQAAIYPDWWPGSASAPASHRQTSSVRQRPQPRLAYSRPPAAPPSVTADDLPTAAFLLVPPRVAAASIAGGCTGRKGSLPKAVAGAAGAAQGAPPRVESRVKLQHAQRLALHGQEQVEQAHQAAARPGACGSSTTAIADEHEPSSLRSGMLGEVDALRSNADAVSPRYQPEAVARWMRHFGLV